MVKFMCSCGSTEFEIEAKTHDTVMFGVDVDAADGSFNTTYAGKEYSSEEMEFSETVECTSCNRVYNLEDIKKGLHEEVSPT